MHCSESYDSSGDQQGLVNTVGRVGIELGSNPTAVGESRSRGERILFKYPLVVWFRHYVRLERVVVFKVGLTRR
jgi:hypothetical protein